MVYADYAYYDRIYRGNAVPEAEFDRLARRASERVDALTLGRAEAAFERMSLAIKDATCAVAEALLEAERGNPLLPGGQAVKMEITGRHHVAYRDAESTAGEAGRQATERAVRRAAAVHLARTGLMWRGAEVR